MALLRLFNVVRRRRSQREASILARTESQILLQNAQRFAASIFDAGAETDGEGVIRARLWDEFRGSGLAMSPFPGDLGGAGLSDPVRHNELCAILRLLGSADLSVARIFEGHVNAVSLVARYGDHDQLRVLSDRVARGGLSAVWGADDAKGLHVIDGNKRVLRAEKFSLPAPGLSPTRWSPPPAPMVKSCACCTLPWMRRSICQPGSAQGMRSTATGAIELSGIPVTSENIIGKPGDFMRQPNFSGGAWRFCAAHVGATERLVDLFRDHLVARGRGEDPYQLERLAHCVASAKTSRHWVEEAARRLSAEDSDGGNVVAFANLTRMVTERCALDVMEHVQRGVGLTSFIRPHPIERISRDLATYLRQPVPDLAMSDGAKAFLSSSLSVGEF